MNRSESQLRINPRIVPPDLLLKFGYSADTGIKFDSAAQTLSFYQGGTKRADLTSFGLAVRNGDGLVVGHTAQIATGGVTSEVQILGTASNDSSLLLYASSTTDGTAPSISFAKSASGIIGTETTVVADGETLGTIFFRASDGTDVASQAALIQAQIDGTPGGNDVPGRLIFATAANGAASPTEAMRIDSSQGVYIGDTANANMTLGLTINQGTNDNQILALKSSDIATVLTTATVSQDVETDDFFTVKKTSTTGGGVAFQTLAESGQDQSFFHDGYSGAVPTTDTSASLAGMNWHVAEHDGANGLNDMAANSNAMAWGEINSSGSRLTRMLLKADDGELHLGNTTLVGLDNEPDALVVRAMQKASASSGIIESEYDNPFYDYKWLQHRGLVGEKDGDGFFLFPLQSRMHAHEGAIWQNYTAHMSLVDRVDNLTIELTEAKRHLAALEA